MRLQDRVSMTCLHFLLHRDGSFWLCVSVFSCPHIPFFGICRFISKGMEIQGKSEQMSYSSLKHSLLSYSISQLFPGQRWESMPFIANVPWSGRSRKEIGKPDRPVWRSCQSYSGTLTTTLCPSVCLYTSLTTPTRSTHMQKCFMIK